MIGQNMIIHSILHKWKKKKDNRKDVLKIKNKKKKLLDHNHLQHKDVQRWLS